MFTQEDFIELLRDGLSHLYDTDHLRQSRLGVLFCFQHEQDSVSCLRDLLIGAVESLKPLGSVPSQSRDWRLYDALFYAYVQQLDQRIVADQLSLSVRHLRREQRAALEILADHLWPRVDPTALEDSVEASLSLMAGPTDPAVIKELTWLKDLPSEKPTALNQAVTEALALVAPLAEQSNVTMTVRGMDALPPLAVHPVALNQILLNIVSVALSQASRGSIELTAQLPHWEIHVWIEAHSDQPAMPLSTDDVASLAMAHELATMSGGSVELAENVDGLKLLLKLPVLNQLSVLAIDDNADTLQLMDRYTAGTRYRIVACQDPQYAIEVATKCLPKVITLDVMMPQVDGWKVLGMLRQHPLTAHVPVVICSILTQEKLALSLGATGFLKKPFTRQSLLEMLDRQLSRARHSVDAVSR